MKSRSSTATPRYEIKSNFSFHLIHLIVICSHCFHDALRDIGIGKIGSWKQIWKLSQCGSFSAGACPKHVGYSPLCSLNQLQFAFTLSVPHCNDIFSSGGFSSFIFSFGRFLSSIFWQMRSSVSHFSVCSFYVGILFYVGMHIFVYNIYVPFFSSMRFSSIPTFFIHTFYRLHFFVLSLLRVFRLCSLTVLVPFALAYVFSHSNQLGTGLTDISGRIDLPG